MRLAAAACLALYLLVVGVVPLLHADDGAAPPAGAHVHDAGEHCDPGHDDAHCAPCQLAFGTAAAPASAAPTLPPASPAGAPRDAARRRAASPSFAPTLPRAPPARA